MKNVLLFVFLLLLSTNSYALDWDLLNDDFSSVAAWTDDDTGSGESKQETFDGQGCLKLYVPSGHVGELAARTIATGAFTDYTFEMRFCIDSDFSYFGSNIYDTGATNYVATLTVSPVRLRARIPDVGGVATYRYCDFDFNRGEWNKIRIVKKSNKATIYVNDLLYLYDTDPRTVNSIDNSVYLYAVGDATNNQVIYIDYARLDSTPEGISTSPLSIGDQKIAIRYRQETDNVDYINGVEALRMYGGVNLGDNKNVLSIPLVDTAHSLASKVRIKTASGTKALMKLPTF
jgi:hypothetical protein